MEYRDLGRTGMKVSALSYGASSLGGVFHHVNDAEGIRAVHTALDMGINFVDVAPFYGLTKAETQLGKALQGIDRNRYFLATKVGRYGETVKDFDFSPKRVVASVDESLERLGVDYLDIIQVHDMEFGGTQQIVNETIPALIQLKETGKVRFVGITGLPLQNFKNVLDQFPANTIDTILSYCHYELNDTSLLDLVPYLEERGVGVINASPTGMGLLTRQGTPAWHPALDEIKATCRLAADHCELRGEDIVKLAIKFSTMNRAITTTLVGTASPTEIRNNVRWSEEAIDPTLLEEVQAILEPIKNKTWISGDEKNN